jgi:hypothetical protein
VRVFYNNLKLQCGSCLVELSCGDAEGCNLRTTVLMMQQLLLYMRVSDPHAAHATHMTRLMGMQRSIRSQSTPAETC